jgi:hypothetical protein
MSHKNWNREIKNTEQESWSPDQFGKKIIGGIFGEPIPYPSAPSRFQIPSFLNDSFNELERLARAQRKKNEMLMYCKTGRGVRKLEVGTEISVGTPDHVMLTKHSIREVEGDEGEVIVGTFHTHPGPNLISPGDLSHLFLRHPHYSPQFIGVITTAQRYIAFRTGGTRFFDAETEKGFQQQAQLAKTWYAEARQKLTEESRMRNSELGFFKSWIYTFFKPKEWLLFQDVVLRQILIEMCEKEKVHLYVSDAENNLYLRLTNILK